MADTLDILKTEITNGTTTLTQYKLAIAAICEAEENLERAVINARSALLQFKDVAENKNPGGPVELSVTDGLRLKCSFDESVTAAAVEAMALLLAKDLVAKHTKLCESCLALTSCAP